MTIRMCVHALRGLAVLVSVCAALGNLRPAAASGQCIDYAQGVRWVGGLDTPTQFSLLDGNLLYATTRDFHVFDVSDPTAPILLASLNNPTGTHDSASFGPLASHNNLLVAIKGFELFVFDVADPTAPTLRGAVYITRGSDVVLDQNLAYMTRNGAGRGFAVVDVANPDAPQVIGSFSSDAFFSGAHGIDISGALVYLAADDGVSVVDVSDPTSPTLVGSVGGLGDPRKLKVVGNTAYVVVSDASATPPGLYAIDVTDPTAPVLIGCAETPDSEASMLRVVGTRAYTTGGSGVDVFDVSDPTAITWLGKLGRKRFATTIEATSTHAFAGDVAGINTFDLSGPVWPGVIGHAWIPEVDVPHTARSIATQGSLVYITAHNAGNGFDFRVVDASDPTAPAMLADLGFSGFPGTVALTATHAYVSGFQSNSHVVDITSPSAPTVVGRFRGGFNLFVAGDVLFSTEYYRRGVDVYDIGNRAAPVLMGQQELPGNTSDVAVAGDLIVVVGDPFLSLVRMHKERTLKHFGSVALPLAASDVVIHGDFAYVSVRDTPGIGALCIVDITKKNHPRITATQPLISDAAGLDLDYPYAYVATSGVGVEVLDVTDPYAPNHLGVMAVAGGAHDVAVGDQGVFMTGRGLTVIPKQCAAAAEVVPAPSALRKPLAIASPTAVLAAWPSPTSRGTQLRFDLGRATDVSMNVYDPRGRLVRRLLAAAHAPGRHTVHWDGRDEHGRDVGAGIYFVKLTLDGDVHTSRVMLLR